MDVSEDSWSPLFLLHLAFHSSTLVLRSNVTRHNTHFAPLNGSPLHVSSLSVPRSHLSAHCRRRPQQSLSLSCSPCLHSPTNSLWLLLYLLFALTTSEPAGSFRAKWCLLFHPSRRLGSVQQKRAITNFRARTMLHLYSGPCRRFRHSHEVGPNRWYSRRSLVVAGLSLGMSAPNASEMNARWHSPVSLADANGFCTSVTSVPGSCPCCQTRQGSETWLDQSWELHDLSHLAQWFTLCKFHKQCWRSCTRVVELNLIHSWPSCCMQRDGPFASPSTELMTSVPDVACGVVFKLRSLVKKVSVAVHSSCHLRLIALLFLPLPFVLPSPSPCLLVLVGRAIKRAHEDASEWWAKRFVVDDVAVICSCCSSRHDLRHVCKLLLCCSCSCDGFCACCCINTAC